tara:strand:- start:1299 stop:1718 length:420 start_codon:yes stop_codon:yes gene_type:complete
MKVIKNFTNYINESADSDKKLIDKIFRLLPASRKTVDWDHRGRLYLPSVNGEDSMVHILSRADMAEWESEFIERYDETPRYKVELTDKDQDYSDWHHINDVQAVNVEITNEVFKEKKNRFSRGKSEFLNDPNFPNSSKD